MNSNFNTKHRFKVKSENFMFLKKENLCCSETEKHFIPVLLPKLFQFTYSNQQGHGLNIRISLFKVNRNLRKNDFPKIQKPKPEISIFKQNDYVVALEVSILNIIFQNLRNKVHF